MSEKNVKTSDKRNMEKDTKKEVEASCWNCFSTVEGDNDLGPITLPKVREKHRKKLKLYSFLASELSKPKTVPFKQKVSENYIIGKRIDEKLAVSEIAENDPEKLNNKSNIKAVDDNATSICESCKSKKYQHKLERSENSSSVTNMKTNSQDTSIPIDQTNLKLVQSNEFTLAVPTIDQIPSVNIDKSNNLEQELNESTNVTSQKEVNKQTNKKLPDTLNKKSISTTSTVSREIDERNQKFHSVETELVYKRVIENPVGNKIYDSFMKDKKTDILANISTKPSLKNNESIKKISKLDSMDKIEVKKPISDLYFNKTFYSSGKPETSDDTKLKTSENIEEYSPDSFKLVSIKENTLDNDNKPISKIRYGLFKKSSISQKDTENEKTIEHLPTIVTLQEDHNIPRAKPLLLKQKTVGEDHVNKKDIDLKENIQEQNNTSLANKIKPIIICKTISPTTNTNTEIISVKDIKKHEVTPDKKIDSSQSSHEKTVSLKQLFRDSVATQVEITDLVNSEGNSTPTLYKKTFEDTSKMSPKKEEDMETSHKIQINTSTPVSKDASMVKIPFEDDRSSIYNSKYKSLESRQETILSDKGDNTSSNGSESGYAGSLPAVPELREEAKSPSTKLEKAEEILLPIENDDEFSKEKAITTSLSSLNKRTILKTSSLTSGIDDAGKKPPLKSLRWNTLTLPSRSFSFQEEVYMSDSVSPGHATLPRRSNSPLPHERDLDRDRFQLNRSGLQARSESMASVYSGAGEGMRGNVTIRGEVQFSLLYNYRLGALEVGVKRCRDLAPIDVKRNRSDPYVKVYLLPDKSKAGKRKTKVKKNTLNPVFEETLSFVQPLASLSARTLWLSAWHADMFGRNDFLGEVTLPLADVVFDDPAPMWYKLHERTEQFDEQQGTRGDLVIGLKYEPDARGKGTLHVLVKEAKNLVATKPNGLADVFCKSYLLPERGRLAKQKTSVARRSLSPRWEHTFTYRGLAPHELAARALELSLWDRDRLASNDFMGAVRLSLGTGTYMGASVNWMDSVGKEVALWQAMLQSPTLWVEGSLPLRPQLNN